MLLRTSRKGLADREVDDLVVGTDCMVKPMPEADKLDFADRSLVELDLIHHIDLEGEWHRSG